MGTWQSPTYRAILTEIVDALLAQVWQGKRPQVRDHMLDVCAQTSRRFDEPWMDHKLAEAWDEGHDAVCAMKGDLCGIHGNPYLLATKATK